MSRLHPLALPLAAVAALAGCADQATAPRTTNPPASPGGAATGAISDAARGGSAGFYWLTPTVLTQPATFPGAFDAAAVSRLAVEVCALAPGGTACDGAPVARYTATTTPFAQQLRADTVRQHVIVYWNTAASGATAGRTYRARVVATGGAAGDVTLGWTDARVVATSGELAGVDRAQAAGVVLGQQLALRFRVERGALPPVGGGAPVTSAPIPADSVRRLAERVYDALAARRDATPEVTNALALVMDVLPTTTSAPAVASYWQVGAPVATDMHAQAVARAMRDTVRMTVDNFATAAAQRGAFVRATGAPLTAEALTTVLAPLVGRATYAPREFLPALVLALGQVRADRAASAGAVGPRDAVWGDRALDALQGTLMLYATEMLGRTAPPAASAPAAVRASRLSVAASAAEEQKKRGEEAVDFVAGEIGLPKDRSEGVKAAICGSVLIYSYRFDVQGTPTQLGTDNIGLPTSSEVTATLVFDFRPSPYGRVVINQAGCEIPENGPAANKGILWRVDEDLRKHGRLTQSTDATDAAGRTSATYATNKNVVPVGLRGVAKEDNGTVSARAIGLLPSWGAIELGVGAGVYNPTESGPRLFVKYFEWPEQLQLDFATAFSSYMGGPARYNTAVAGSITLNRAELNGTVYYHDYGPSRYTQWMLDGFRDEGCNYAPTATSSGEFGFIFVAQTTSPFLQSMRGGPVGGVFPEPFEKMTITCGESVNTIKLNMFGTMLGTVYQIMPNAGGLPGGFVKNSLADWTTVQQGTIRATVARTMPGMLGTGDPITERSTFTLRAVR